MAVDIAELLRASLLESGCDPDTLGQFDGHSTIALDFDGAPSIYVNQLDDEVWLWCRLMEGSVNLLTQSATALLEQLLRGCTFSATGQAQLAINEGFVELRALVRKECLESAKAFAGALDEFFIQIEEFVGILR